ncbi:MAG TPA: Gfo/Idh/MocA family oxidoreductase, partial [bacterium]|nr:Gfo/Idh/MocA family oxidoreductase [bacterium]
GYGTWAQRVHIPSIGLSRSAVLTAVCGPDVARARQIAAEAGAELATAHPDELISSSQVDAVLIASPNDAHMAPALAAAQAGKAVLCEKPLAVSLADARRMTDVAVQADVVHMTAFTWRYVPAATLAQRLVSAGEIGRIFHVAGHFLQERWLTPDTTRLWRFDRRRVGSGILGDLGVHLFDLLEWMTGQRVVRVCAGLASFGWTPEAAGQQTPVFDDAHLLLEFSSAARGTVHLSRVAKAAGESPFPLMHQGIEIYGERGAILYDLHSHSRVEVRPLDRPTRRIPVPDPLPTSDDEWVVTRELGRRQIERFAQAVQTRTGTAPDFHAGLRAQTIVDAAERSWEARAWVASDDGGRTPA